jgi:hypothetical protein
MARREPKSFGIDNWFDGQILSNMPVLLMDDVAASTNHMLLASARIRHMGLPLHHNYFAVVNKVGRGVPKEAQHTENYLDGGLACLFTLNNFCLTSQSFKERYGHAPKWTGFVG